jgi:hypothetical protein
MEAMAAWSGPLSADIRRDTVECGPESPEGEELANEPQRMHILFSRIYACRMERLLQQANSR